MNINAHPIYKAIYELCLEIEKLPASEQETKVVCMAGALEKPAKRLIDALEAVLLFHSASPWDEGKKTQWWNLTQTNEATTRNLCDSVRLALGRLPSCFGGFAGRIPSALPSDFSLNHEQRKALAALEGRRE